MLRRRHKKSRAGCLECPTSGNNNGDGTDPLLLIDDADGAINVSHAELIVHLMSNQDIQSLAANREDLTSGMILGLRAGIRTPYLLYAMLAFSARHLSFLAANGSDNKSNTGSKSTSQETPEQNNQPPWMPSSASLPSQSSSLSMASSSSPSSISSPSLSTANSPAPPQPSSAQPGTPQSQSKFPLPSSLPPLSFSSTPPYVTQTAAAAARYKRQAVLLQTRAISLFNTAWRASDGVMDRSNCVPMLLFSSVLGHHLFADSLSRRDDTLDKFLEHYVQCAQLQQGVHAIAITTWPFLVVSEFAPILQWSARFTSREGRGNDCAQLLTLVNGAADDRLNAAEKDACRRAIRLLQVGFDVLYLPAPKTSKTPSTSRTSRNGSADADAMDMDAPADLVTSEEEKGDDDDDDEESGEEKAEHTYRHKMILLWALIMPKEFADLMAVKNPESLIILAYYACLLNHGRHLWQVQDAGEYIMGLINDYMDPAWDKWLEEPRRRMATDVVEAPPEPKEVRLT
ncbi:hypothetical protein Sste5346_008116 [Sporothrix stenoceras]|uniref:C6 zinc finger domain containing protein n=1 Tax=Sporothrix stenoceras TaxID=5173 RepID=A0ABR3YRH9_9PEZI